MKFEKGVHEIKKQIEIKANEELIIEAGAVLKFAEKASIYCEGKITAIGSEGKTTVIGTNDELIHFTSLNEGGSWGGLLIYSQKPVRFAFCRFEGANKPLGGAVYIQDSNDVVFKNCIFRKNQATRGGAVCYINSSVKFTECNFVENGTREEGGAIYFKRLQANDFHEPKDCLFLNNTAKEGYNIYGIIDKIKTD